MFLLGGDVDKHQGLAVAPETVLQQVGQLGVPVWHVGRLLRQSHDDVAEVGERLVDGLGLGQTDAFTAALLHSLTAGKVHLNKESPKNSPKRKRIKSLNFP